MSFHCNGLISVLYRLCWRYRYNEVLLFRESWIMYLCADNRHVIFFLRNKMYFRNFEKYLINCFLYRTLISTLRFKGFYLSKIFSRLLKSCVNIEITLCECVKNPTSRLLIQIKLCPTWLKGFGSYRCMKNSGKMYREGRGGMGEGESRREGEADLLFYCWIK